MRRILAPLAVLLLLAPAGRGGGPTLQQLAGAETIGKGTLEGLSLDEQGILRPGPVFDATPLDAPTAWAALQVGDVTWVGTGNRAEVLRVSKDASVRRISTGEGGLMVTALAPLGNGAVAAAVFPGGKVLKVTADGEVEALATVPAEHVWALAPQGPGLVAATGVPGALFSVDGTGRVERLAEVGDDHARCLARRGDEWLVGTSPKGKVLSVRGAEVRVVRDLDPQEVVGLLPTADGGLLVAANADQAGGNAQAIANVLKQMVEPAETKPGAAPAARASLQDGRILWIEPGGVLTSLWEAKQVALLALAADGKGAVAGTYPAGRLVRVETGSPASVLADLAEAEASVVLEGASVVVTSNPAVLHRRQGTSGRGTFTSGPVDAGATARWGRATVTGSGITALEWRGGETSEPDASWGPWTAAGGFDGSGGTLGATARFLQVRVGLEGAGAELREVNLVTETPNRAPAVTELAVKKPGEGGGPTPVRELTWKAADPDEDRLQVSIHANRDGSPHWIELLKEQVLEKPTFSWDTSGLPDGVYRVRVTVSDAPDTVSDRAREGTRTSGPLRIDNTAPRVQVTARLEGGKLVVAGEAADQPGGRVASVKVSVDGAPFRHVAAADGLYDSPTERFSSTLPPPAPGPHDVVVQASDAEGNVGAAAAVLK